MSENKRRNYMVFGLFILFVIGLGFNSWNENRKDENTRQEFQRQLDRGRSQARSKELFRKGEEDIRRAMEKMGRTNYVFQSNSVPTSTAGP